MEYVVTLDDAPYEFTFATQQLACDFIDDEFYLGGAVDATLICPNGKTFHFTSPGELQ